LGKSQYYLKYRTSSYQERASGARWLRQRRPFSVADGEALRFFETAKKALDFVAVSVEATVVEALV
jgi:hypothetical protein